MSGTTSGKIAGVANDGKRAIRPEYQSAEMIAITAGLDPEKLATALGVPRDRIGERIVTMAQSRNQGIVEFLQALNDESRANGRDISYGTTEQNES